MQWHVRTQDELGRTVTAASQLPFPTGFSRLPCCCLCLCLMASLRNTIVPGISHPNSQHYMSVPVGPKVSML